LMALYLINGLPGTGKTTVCHALRLLGVGAWDADEDDLACWRGADGVPVPDPPPHQRDAAFIASHTRDIPPEAVARLASTTTGEPGFLCGDPENATELYPFFAALFALDADDRTIIHRLVTREGNNWGKAPHERERVLASANAAREHYAAFDYAILDATQPVSAICDFILAETLVRAGSRPVKLPHGNEAVLKVALSETPVGGGT
jgi:hypothetical protein